MTILLWDFTKGTLVHFVLKAKVSHNPQHYNYFLCKQKKSLGTFTTVNIFFLYFQINSTYRLFKNFHKFPKITTRPKKCQFYLKYWFWEQKNKKIRTENDRKKQNIFVVSAQYRIVENVIENKIQKKMNVTNLTRLTYIYKYTTDRVRIINAKKIKK